MQQKINSRWAARRPQAKVKRCGKSAPAFEVTQMACKPRSEQDQIGVLWRGPRRTRVGCLRLVVTRALEEWLLKTEPGLQADSKYG